MAEVSMYMTPSVRPAVPTEVRVTTVLDDRARQTVKTAVHHELKSSPPSSPTRPGDGSACSA